MPKQKDRPTPNLVTLKIITENALLNTKNDLMMTNIHGQLDQSPSADVNSNYDIMFNEIHRVVEKHISSKTVKLNKYKHKKIEMDSPSCYKINKMPW